MPLITDHRTPFMEDRMQLKDPNLHLKLQEMCECYLETDFMSQLRGMTATPSGDPAEDAIKYLALAIMTGVTDKAKKLKLQRKKDSIKASLKVGVEKILLPPPSAELFAAVIDLVRGILHFESEGGKMALILGLRNSQFELQVKLKQKEEKTSLKITFPDLAS
jgi:hypothetical protein